MLHARDPSVVLKVGDVASAQIGGRGRPPACLQDAPFQADLKSSYLGVSFLQTPGTCESVRPSDMVCWLAYVIIRRKVGRVLDGGGGEEPRKEAFRLLAVVEAPVCHVNICSGVSLVRIDIPSAQQLLRPLQFRELIRLKRLQHPHSMSKTYFDSQSRHAAFQEALGLVQDRKTLVFGRVSVQICRQLLLSFTELRDAWLSGFVGARVYPIEVCSCVILSDKIWRHKDRAHLEMQVSLPG